MTRSLTLIALLGIVCGGCYTTRLGSELAAGSGPMQTERQWFGLLGAIPYSDRAEPKCIDGQSIVYVESGLGGYDILIDVGLSLAGAAIGAGIASAADEDISDEDLSAAANTGALFAPLIASRRTIRWTCSASKQFGALPAAPEPFALPNASVGQ
ncbi:MAG: hypothetical protein AAFU77_15405 [Myxococcota bacterium]